MNDEVLLLVSLGICFGMVLLAEHLGFSSALGAFLAGSLLSNFMMIIASYYEQRSSVSGLGISTPSPTLKVSP